jgi:hypothetical protein
MRVEEARPSRPQQWEKRGEAKQTTLVESSRDNESRELAARLAARVSGFRDQV